MEAACSVQFSPPVTIDDLQTSQFLLTQSLSKQSHHSIASVGKNVMLDLLPCRTTCEPASSDQEPPHSNFRYRPLGFISSPEDLNAW